MFIISLMSFQMETQSNYSNEEYDYSDNESVCSKSRKNFKTREDYMQYLESKGKGYSFDDDGYKVPKIDFCGYIHWPRDGDYIRKFNPESYWDGMWKDEQSYLNFWNKFFEDFYNDKHSKKDDVELFKLYLKFKDTIQQITAQKSSKLIYDLNSTDLKKGLEEEDYDASYEPDEPTKYSKKHPIVTKFIKKHQPNTLPEHLKKLFNQKVTTNKTIKVPITRRYK